MVAQQINVDSLQNVLETKKINTKERIKLYGLITHFYLVLYRCAYELVSNALKHARASHIDVHFTTDNETAYLSVVDNGCGFDPQKMVQGMGIKNLRTRLAAFGGNLEIFSEPGKGTEANVELKML